MKHSFFSYINALIFCLFTQVCSAVSPSDVLSRVNDWYDSNPYSERIAIMTGESNGTYLSSELAILRSHTNWVVRSVYSDPYQFELLHYWGKNSDVYVHFPKQEMTCIDEDPLTNSIFRETSLLQSRSVAELQDLGYKLKTENFEDYVKLSLGKRNSTQLRLDFHIDTSGEILRINMTLGQDEFSFAFKDKALELTRSKKDTLFVLSEMKKRIDEEVEKTLGLNTSDDETYVKLLENEIVISFQEKVLGIK